MIVNVTTYKFIWTTSWAFVTKCEVDVNPDDTLIDINHVVQIDPCIDYEDYLPQYKFFNLRLTSGHETIVNSRDAGRIAELKGYKKQ